MSKLTNHQILAQIDSLERSVMRDAAALLNSYAGRRRQQRLTIYKEELAQREAEGADLRTHDLQDVRKESNARCKVTIEWEPSLPDGPHGGTMT